MGRNGSDRGADLQPWWAEKVWNFPINPIKTMSIPKSSWRKPPKSKKGAMICTRPIFQAASPQSKTTQFKGVLWGQFATANGRTEQPREGHERHCFQFQPTPLPSSHAILTFLPNTMLVDTPTHSSSHKLSYFNAKSFCVRPCFNANCVAIALEVYVNRDLHILGI